MATLRGLVQKGVKVDLGIPLELWDEPSVEVTFLKKQVGQSATPSRLGRREPERGTEPVPLIKVGPGANHEAMMENSTTHQCLLHTYRDPDFGPCSALFPFFIHLLLLFPI